MRDGDFGSILPRDSIRVPVVVVVIDVGPIGLALGVVGMEPRRHVDAVLFKFFVGILLRFRWRNGWSVC